MERDIVAAPPSEVLPGERLGTIPGSGFEAGQVGWQLAHSSRASPGFGTGPDQSGSRPRS